MGWYRGVSACVVTAACVACAGPSTNIPGLTTDEIALERRKQQIFQIQNYYSQLARLNNHSYRLTLANRADCREDVAPRLGFSSIAPSELPDKYKNLAVEAMSLTSDRATVVSVAAGGPAAKAGIAAGDELLSFNDEPLPADNPSEWIASFLRRNGERPVRVEVLRAGKSRVHTVATVMTCSVPVFLFPDEQSNAFTDGKRIVIYSGILRIAQTDAELASIVGHELAHVTMGHVTKRQQNRTAGAVGGAVVDIGLAVLGVSTGGAFTRGLGNAGAQAYATDFEREADYVGAYYTARAGYDSSAAENLWRAMALESPRQIFYTGLHPTSPERFLLMQKTNAEIADKKRRGMALVPESRPATVTTVAATEPVSN